LGLVEDSRPNTVAEEVAAFFLEFLVGVTCHRKNAFSRFDEVSQQLMQIKICKLPVLSRK
jgi:hypothetical protein